MPTFPRVTHLHLIPSWTSDAIACGFQNLPSLTHLSMTWKTSQMVTHEILALLGRRNFKVILLWLDNLDDKAKVIASLRQRNLDDPRIVLLRRASKWSNELSGGFWLHAERIIAWREYNNSKYGDLCFYHRTNRHCSRCCGIFYNDRDHGFGLHTTPQLSVLAMGARLI